MASEYFVDCLVDAIDFDLAQDLVGINGEKYRELKDLVGVLGEDWKPILLALPDRAPWTPHGGLLYQPIYWFEAEYPETWERESRLFCCDCAERALSALETVRPDDDRPRRALEVARRYAVGEATEEERQRAYGAAERSKASYAPEAEGHINAYYAGCAATLAASSRHNYFIYKAPRYAVLAATQGLGGGGEFEREAQWKLLVNRLCREA